MAAVADRIDGSGGLHWLSSVTAAVEMRSEASSQAGEQALDRLDEMPASPVGAGALPCSLLTSSRQHRVW